MRSSLQKTFMAIMVGCMVLAFASPSFGQWRGRPTQSRYQIDRLIRQAESRSNQFVIMFDRSLDNSRLEGTFREDRLNQQAAQLEQHLNVMRQHLNQTGNYNAMRAHLARTMTLGQSINTVVRNRRLNPAMERQWSLLRYDLN